MKKLLLLIILAIPLCIYSQEKTVSIGQYLSNYEAYSVLNHKIMIDFSLLQSQAKILYTIKEEYKKIETPKTKKYQFQYEHGYEYKNIKREIREGNGFYVGAKGYLKEIECSLLLSNGQLNPQNSLQPNDILFWQKGKELRTFYNRLDLPLCWNRDLSNKSDRNIFRKEYYSSTWKSGLNGHCNKISSIIVKQEETVENDAIQTSYIQELSELYIWEGHLTKNINLSRCHYITLSDQDQNIDIYNFFDVLARNLTYKVYTVNVFDYQSHVPIMDCKIKFGTPICKDKFSLIGELLSHPIERKVIDEFYYLIRDVFEPNENKFGILLGNNDDFNLLIEVIHPSYHYFNRSIEINSNINSINIYLKRTNVNVNIVGEGESKSKIILKKQ